MALKEVEIPFDLEASDLSLDPAAKGWSDPIYGHILWLKDTAWSNERFEEELERITRAATVLYAADAGTFQECWKTAVIWERG